MWFGWTENPRSRKAKRLDKVKKLLLQGLYAAPQAMSADEDSTRGRIGRTDQGVVKPEGRKKKDREQRAEIEAAWKEFPGAEPTETKLYTELVIPDN